MSEQEVRSWEETKLSHHNIGIPRMCLNEFLKDFKQSFHLSNEKLLETFTQTIKQLFLDCDISGQTSTIWGDLDEKTKIYALIHCVRDDEDDTVSVYYTVHTASCKLARKNVTMNLTVKRGVEIWNKMSQVSAAASAVIRTMGVRIDLPSLPSLETGEDNVNVN